MDPWCRPIMANTGNIVSGGAARNVRIANSGGMDEIIYQAGREAARRALELANQKHLRSQDKPKLQIAA